MVIHFSCSNGHQLSAPDDRVGMTGRCPKCEEQFTIPAPDHDKQDHKQSLEDEEDDFSLDDVDNEADNNEADDGGHAAGEPETIVFLCPNKHKLTGPATMRGKVGRCPHCGSKFRIPERAGESDAALDEAEGDAGGDVLNEQPTKGDSDAASSGVMSGDGDSSATIGKPAASPSRTADRDQHEMANVLRQIWENRTQGAKLTIQLRSGEAVEAEFFSPPLSRDKFGVFASRSAGGATVSAIAWEDIVHVSLDVSKLPVGLFQ